MIGLSLWLIKAVKSQIKSSSSAKSNMDAPPYRNRTTPYCRPYFIRRIFSSAADTNSFIKG